MKGVTLVILKLLAITDGAVSMCMLCDSAEVMPEDKMLLAAAVISAASYLLDQSRTDRVCCMSLS